MIVNIIQRPEKSEAYEFQRKISIDLGLRVTIALPASLIEEKEVVDLVKSDSEKYGHEVMLWLDAKGFPWLLSREDKNKSIKASIERFKTVFGYYPKAAGHYVLDSECIKIIRDCCPEIRTVIAGCFEEGVRVFHGCNNSWYLFSEGMSWTGWYPSKTHSLRPAADEEDWSGVVAVPHLSRDLVQAYEGRDDFFASHMPNVQRGLGNEGRIHEYDYNLIDQYRMQDDFNGFDSYYQVHVSSWWLKGCPNVIDSDDITRENYVETMKYIARLCGEGKAKGMTLSEYGEYYRKNVPIGGQTVGVGKDILYGSGKQYFWLFGKSFRAVVDIFQGGSIGDLRPYAGRYEAVIGLDSDKPLMGSYPYIIQSQFRTGVKNHCCDGSRTTLIAEHNGEKLDMCFCPTKIKEVFRNGNVTKLVLEPVVMEFKDGYRIKVRTVYVFTDEGIEIYRQILERSEGECEFCEYIKGCYGFTEYPEEMRGITFGVDDVTQEFKYRNREVSREGGKCAFAEIPQVTARVELCADDAGNVTAREGNLFEPYYLLTAKQKINNTKETKVCLKMKKIQKI